MNFLLLYFALQADSLIELFRVVAILSGLVGGVLLAHSILGFDRQAALQRAYVSGRNLLIVAAVSGLATALTPSTKTILTIAGVGVVAEAAEAIKNKEELQQLPDNIIKLLNQTIEKKLNETK